MSMIREVVAACKDPSHNIPMRELGNRSYHAYLLDEERTWGTYEAAEKRPGDILGSIGS